MSTERIGYWRNLWNAVSARKPGSASGGLPAANTSGVPTESLTLPEALSRIATLEMESRDRADQIAGMKREYEQLVLDRQRDDSGSRKDETTRLFKRLCGPLSNLMALSGMARTGREIDSNDLLELVDVLQRELGRAGLEMIGVSGELCPFNVAWHQRLSGSAVQADTPVRIQIPGFRLGETVLTKAMVTTQE